MTLELTLDATLDLSRSDARHGYGLFETIRVKDGRPLRLSLHRARLERGAAFLDMDPPPSLETLETFLAQRTQVPGMSSGVLRLYAVDRRLIVSAMAFSPEVRNTVAVDLADTLVRHSSSPLNAFKTLAYLENRILAREARDRDLFEVIALNERGELTDGSRTTLFLVEGGRVFTPPVSAGALPGVARQVILEAGLAQEATLTPADLVRCEGLFLTNSLQGLIPVHFFRGRALKQSRAVLEPILDLLNQGAP
ncbi:aminotransferase class IV [Holophaga foetida]|uniref:aminotransferase class IV n=1 Tax=Holophaga foetida TaxID=35839 RepID=UPI000247181F|nr:aminotransferase class IV [Holophaga foetida]